MFVAQCLNYYLVLTTSDSIPVDVGDALSTTAYVCCPTGYGVQISYLSSNTYDTLWPLCTGQATVITNAWRISAGWPSTQPTSFDLFTTTAMGDYAWFTPIASAIMVGWQSTDSTVIQYLDTARIYLPVPCVSLSTRFGQLLTFSSGPSLARPTINRIIIYRKAH
jgi:hypothetical protein